MTPVREGIVVSPADGRVSRDRQCGAAAGTRARRPAAAAHLDLHERVRLPREPQPGDAAASSASSITPGAFLNADLDKASEDNERNGFVIVDRRQRRIGVVQIAGLIARRIVCFVREGAGDRRRRAHRPDPLRLARRRLSARGVRPLVAEGQTAIAGETVIADLQRRRSAPRSFRVG